MRVTFFDISNAFNTIRYGQLRDKLEHSWVDPHLTAYIRNYLTNRTTVSLYM